MQRKNMCKFFLEIAAETAVWPVKKINEKIDDAFFGKASQAHHVFYLWNRVHREPEGLEIIEEKTQLKAELLLDDAFDREDARAQGQAAESGWEHWLWSKVPRLNLFGYQGHATPEKEDAELAQLNKRLS